MTVSRLRIFHFDQVMEKNACRNYIVGGFLLLCLAG